MTDTPRTALEIAAYKAARAANDLEDAYMMGTVDDDAIRRYKETTAAYAKALERKVAWDRTLNDPFAQLDPETAERILAAVYTTWKNDT